MNVKKIFISFIANFFVILFISGNISTCAQGTYTCDYMYNILETRAEKNFYDELYKTCELVDNSYNEYLYTPYTSYGNISFNRAKEVAFIFTQDHPEYFWLSAQMRVSSLYGVAFKLIDDFQNGNERQFAKTQIKDAAQVYINFALEYSKDYDRVRYFCDELLKNVKYEYGNWDQTIASVFLQNQTVCAGYSKAFEMLCNAVGIDTIILTSCNHAWNAVKIDKRWYLIDVTNNSSDNYFLISDSKMAGIDEAIGVKYEVTQVVDGRETIYEFYPHEIDYLTYTNYYDDFPECKICYSELSDGAEDSVTRISILGDSNLDGVVNIIDAAYIARMVAKRTANKLPECADYNEDGKTDILDAASIARDIARRKI